MVRDGVGGGGQLRSFYFIFSSLYCFVYITQKAFISLYFFFRGGQALFFFLLV